MKLLVPWRESLVTDIAVIAFFGIIFQSTETMCRKKVFPMIASKLLRLNKQSLIQNFSKQACKLLWHSFCLILELMIFVNSDCWASIVNPYNPQHGTQLFWKNTARSPPTDIWLLYLVQTGYYVTNLVYILFIESPNDLLVMTSHHIATLGLIAVSYIPVVIGNYAASPLNGWKIGAVVMLIHEIGDVTLAVCKLLHYAQMKTISEMIFATHIVGWIWIRIVWFPRIVVSCLIDHTPSVYGEYRWRFWTGFVLLSLLWILNIFWCRYMLKLLFKAVVKKEKISDSRDKKRKSIEFNEIVKCVWVKLTDFAAWKLHVCVFLRSISFQ